MADACYDGFDAIEVLDEVDSTNEELMKRARAGAPEGTALRARVQQSGRGRRSHGWTSPEGGLYLSVLIKPKVPDRVLSGLPVACGIGVANALEQIGCEGVQLKWPNDVVTPKGKLGGILVELGRSSGEKLAVCGLGINFESIKMEWRDPNALPIAGLVDCMPEGSEAPSLDELAGLVEDAASQAGGMRDALSETLASVSSSANGAAQTLSSGAEGLTKMADDLDAAAGRLSDLHDKLRSALDSHDAQQVRAVLSAGPTELARFVAEPVSVERTAVFPVENNGSAMAPFYTTLAIWIGGVVLAALVRTAPSEAALEETGCSAGQAYLGRLALFCAVGVAQAALIWGGDLLYLGVQCEHPWLMLLACVTSSIVYVNVIFSLAASFGDVGKAVAVVLMVIQVAGSGGTFPPEMLPAAFQGLYRWLPFVHSEAALRAAMFGIWDGDFWRELGVLLAYLVPALFLGLVVRRPLIRLGAWFERRLEETHLM